MMKNIFRKLIKRQKGQALIFVITALIIVVFAALLVFDVAHLIKGKIKSRNGVDSAAIIGARWQQHSLNLIGEINIIKASEAIFDFNDSSSMNFYSTDNAIRNRAYLDAINASNELSELQIRVAFVGPMIGFGAAQQAAKNNGLTGHEAMSDTLKEHYNLLANPDVYGSEIMTQTVMGYTWRAPYMKMISDNFNMNSEMPSIAVACNMDMMAQPNVRSDGAISIYAYANRGTIDAILADGNAGWCRLKTLLLRYKEEFKQERWWGNIVAEMENSEPRGSEFLPLQINISGGSFAPIQAEQYLINNGTNGVVLDEEGRVTSDSLMTQISKEGRSGADDFIANSQADKYLRASNFYIYNDKWSAYGEKIVNRWQKYLAGDFKEGYAYRSGAVSFMSARVKNITMTRKYFLDGNKVPHLGLGKKRSYKNASSYNYADSWTTALAKPLGVLSLNGSDHPPFMSNMILPVFKDVSMIPISLEFPGYSKLQDPEFFAFLTKYLPELGTRDTIEEMSDWIQNQTHPEYYQKFHQAMIRLDTLSWRQKGIDWLEEPHYRIVQDEDGNLVKELDGTTNADHCNDWPGGSGGGGGGPGILH